MARSKKKVKDAINEGRVVGVRNARMQTVNVENQVMMPSARTIRIGSSEGSG